MKTQQVTFRPYESMGKDAKKWPKDWWDIRVLLKTDDTRYVEQLVREVHGEQEPLSPLENTLHFVKGAFFYTKRILTGEKEQSVHDKLLQVGKMMMIGDQGKVESCMEYERTPFNIVFDAIVMASHITRGDGVLPPSSLA